VVLQRRLFQEYAGNAAGDRCPRQLIERRQSPGQGRQPWIRYPQPRRAVSACKPTAAVRMEAAETRPSTDRLHRCTASTRPLGRACSSWALAWP